MSEECSDSFDCFGGRVAVRVRSPDGEALVREARATLLDAHCRLSRFDPDSELSRLNEDARRSVPASPLLRQLAVAAYMAGALSGGLVDATLLEEIERLGYVDSLPVDRGDPPSPAPAIGARAIATPSAKGGWCALAVDEEAGCVVRPPGTLIDGGGIAKGLLADLVAERLGEVSAYAVDCCGDIRFGGVAGLMRTILVEDPFGGPPLREFSMQAGAVATSGTTRRSWIGPDSKPAHQIIDPGTGRSAKTGIAQVTALAPTALHAEIFAKAALLSGPRLASDWLPFGGLLVLEDGSVEDVLGRAPLPEAG